MKADTDTENDHNIKSCTQLAFGIYDIYLLRVMLFKSEYIKKKLQVGEFAFDEII